MTRGVLRNPSRNLTGVGPKGLDKLGLRVSESPKRPKDSPEDIPDPPKQIPGPLGGFVGFQGLGFRVQGWGANLGFWI